MFFGARDRAREYFDTRRDNLAAADWGSSVVLAMGVKFEDAQEMVGSAHLIEIFTNSAKQHDQMRRQADAMSGPFPSLKPLHDTKVPGMSYDLIYSRNLGGLEHFTRIIAEMKRLVKSGGSILCAETSKDRVDEITSILPSAKVTKFGLWRPVYVVEWKR